MQKKLSEEELALIRIEAEVTCLNDALVKDIFTGLARDEASVILINYSGAGDLESYANTLLADEQITTHVWESEKIRQFEKGLKKSYREAQKATHPDHFIGSDFEKQANELSQIKNTAWEHLSKELEDVKDFVVESSKEWYGFNFNNDLKVGAAYAKDMGDIAVFAAQRPLSSEYQEALNQKLLDIIDREDYFNVRQDYSFRVEYKKQRTSYAERDSPRHQLALKRIMAALEAGADINVQNRYGETAYQLILRHQYFSSVNMVLLTDYVLDPKKTPFPLKAPLKGPSNLRSAIKAGYGAFLTDIFLKHGETACQTDGDGWTHLHEAIEQGSKATTLKLIKAGADVNAPHAKAGTPFYMAAGSFEQDLLEFMLEKGANANYKHYYSRLFPSRYYTPLSKALISEEKKPLYSHDLYLKMIKAGADVNSREVSTETSNEHTPLIALFKRELTKGLSNPSCPTDDIHHLLTLGANPALVDAQGTSVIDDAKKLGCPPALIDNLIQNGGYSQAGQAWGFPSEKIIASTAIALTALFTFRAPIMNFFSKSLMFTVTLFNHCRQCLAASYSNNESNSDYSENIDSPSPLVSSSIRSVEENSKLSSLLTSFYLSKPSSSPFLPELEYSCSLNQSEPNSAAPPKNLTTSFVR